MQHRIKHLRPRGVRESAFEGRGIMLRIFAMRLLAVVFGCVLIGPARGAVSSPGNAHRIPTPNAFIRQIDATITYSYDANGDVGNPGWIRHQFSGGWGD